MLRKYLIVEKIWIKQSRKPFESGLVGSLSPEKLTVFDVYPAFAPW
jgi:hypothetical protein